MLGRKISIRYRLVGDPEHPFSEAVGVIARVRDAVRDDARGPMIELITRRGQTVEVACDAVLGGKVFPIG